MEPRVVDSVQLERQIFTSRPVLRIPGSMHERSSKRLQFFYDGKALRKSGRVRKCFLFSLVCYINSNKNWFRQFRREIEIITVALTINKDSKLKIRFTLRFSLFTCSLKSRTRNTDIGCKVFSTCIGEGSGRTKRTV